VLDVVHLHLYQLRAGSIHGDVTDRGDRNRQRTVMMAEREQSETRWVLSRSDSGSAPRDAELVLSRRQRSLAEHLAQRSWMTLLASKIIGTRSTCVMVPSGTILLEGFVAVAIFAVRPHRCGASALPCSGPALTHSSSCSYNDGLFSGRRGI
jgi:hypothetical protein